MTITLGLWHKHYYEMTDDGLEDLREYFEGVPKHHSFGDGRVARELLEALGEQSELPAGGQARQRSQTCVG